MHAPFTNCSLPHNTLPLEFSGLILMPPRFSVSGISSILPLDDFAMVEASWYLPVSLLRNSVRISFPDGGHLVLYRYGASPTLDPKLRQQTCVRLWHHFVGFAENDKGGGRPFCSPRNV